MGVVIAELLPVLVKILAEAPAVVDSVEKVWELATAVTPATVAERATFDAALDVVHKALQES